MSKLHLGCGTRRFPDYIHVDGRKETNPDIVADVFLLEGFENNKYDLVYNCHVLEHTDRAGSDKALKRWYEILKPGGILRLSVPDIAACCEWYCEHRDLKTLYAFFWGSQIPDRGNFDYHFHGWDEFTLRKALQHTGFRDVKLWDWRTTPPHDEIDDYCRAYLPHMDFESGKLMSLNIQGTK